MKNVLKGLELNEQDNALTAISKGMTKGYLKYSAIVLPLIGTIALIGKCITNKGELEKFEEEMGE